MWAYGRSTLIAVACAAVAWGAALAAGPVAPAAAATTVPIHFGDPHWVPLTGDWDGSGTTQIGAYDPSTATFYLGDHDGAAISTVHYGDPNWVPLAGDWNRSGRTQIGAYDPSTAIFYLGNHDGAAVTTAQFGDGGNWVPLAGDWNGSGGTQIGAYDPSTAIFYLGDQDGAAITTAHYGDPNWVPLAGDWDGSGADQIGAYDPSSRIFYMGDHNGVSVTDETFGISGDIPIRPSNATFYLQETPKPVPPPVATPVVTTPVPTPLPTPPAGTRAHPRVRVKVLISWTWNRARTRVHEARIGRLPRTGKLTVSCAGRGCPFRVRSTGAKRLKAFTQRLRGTVFRAGDRVTITVSAPGRVSERGVLTIRNGRKPLVKEARR
jgi:uncharacterized protein YuzE